MVSFIGGLALQVKNKNGITVPLSWASFVGPEKAGPVAPTYSIDAAAGIISLKALLSFESGLVK